MKPEEFLKSFSFLLDILIEWTRAILKPLDTAKRINNAASNSEDAFKEATKLWLTAFILSMVIQIPIFHLNGIPWNSMGFYLSSGLVYLLALVAGCFAIYGGLRVYGIKIKFVNLYVLYVVLIGNFSPFISFLNYPLTIDIVAKIDRLKGEGVDLVEAGPALFKSFLPGASSVLFEVYTSLASMLAVVFIFGMLACLINILASELSVSKVRIMNASAFGIVVLGFVPSLLFSALNIFILFAFL